MAWLAWDFLIADDARACWNNRWDDYTKYLGCVMTILNVVALGKTLGVLAKMGKVSLLLKSAGSVDKGREVYKAVKVGTDSEQAYQVIKNLPDDLIKELTGKATITDILGYTKKNGSYIWLEKGNSKVGKIHIFETAKDATGITRYGQLLNDGIIKSEQELFDLIFNIIKNGEKVTDGFTKVLPNKFGVNKSLKVVVGDNGFIITITYI